MMWKPVRRRIGVSILRDYCLGERKFISPFQGERICYWLRSQGVALGYLISRFQREEEPSLTVGLVPRSHRHKLTRTLFLFTSKLQLIQTRIQTTVGE